MAQSKILKQSTPVADPFEPGKDIKTWAVSYAKSKVPDSNPLAEIARKGIVDVVFDAINWYRK